MLFDSPIISRGSGSMAGITASRNRGGNYFRARTLPTNPNTVFQQAVRSLMAQLSGLWSSILTQPERDKWDLYAENVELIGPTGSPRNVGGIGMFQRSNVPRLQAAEVLLPRQDIAPGLFDLGEYTAPAIVSATAATNTLSLTFTNTDEWANEDDSAMLISVSRPQNPGIKFFKGPYRFADVILGNSTTPPTSPAAIISPFPFEVGQRVFIFVRVTRGDGRLSASFRSTVLAA